VQMRMEFCILHSFQYVKLLQAVDSIQTLPWAFTEIYFRPRIDVTQVS